MKNQRRTVLGACEYSIKSMQEIKQGMLEHGSNHQDVMWAIGGIVTTLVSNLIMTCEKVFSESAQLGDSNAHQDISEIKSQFNEFMDRMINDE